MRVASESNKKFAWPVSVSSVGGARARGDSYDIVMSLLAQVMSSPPFLSINTLIPTLRSFPLSRFQICISLLFTLSSLTAGELLAGL